MNKNTSGGRSTVGLNRLLWAPSSYADRPCPFSEATISALLRDILPSSYPAATVKKSPRVP